MTTPALYKKENKNEQEESFLRAISIDFSNVHCTMEGLDIIIRDPRKYVKKLKMVVFRRFVLQISTTKINSWNCSFCC